MHIQTQSPKMIYETQSVANTILNKLIKRNPDNKYTMAKVTAGWQIVPITQCPPFMPPAKPLPVKRPEKTISPTPDTVVVEVPFLRETKAWYYFDFGKGWLHKSHVINPIIENGKLRFLATLKAVQEYGLTDAVVKA